MKTEHRIYQTYVGSITLAHCHYMYPKKYEELCDRQCGSSAYIALRYENSLRSKMESTCPPLIQTIPCHEKPAHCNHKLQLRQCPGLNGIHLLRNLSITPLTIVKVPVLNISTVKGKIVSALEIFVEIGQEMLQTTGNSKRRLAGTIPHLRWYNPHLDQKFHNDQTTVTWFRRRRPTKCENHHIDIPFSLGDDEKSELPSPRKSESPPLHSTALYRKGAEVFDSQ
ncbi:unnamed protein product [Cercopithifilaria johnstoni]|uniref:Uncharacterized protein n=1 Tax=Cercopithifilaria johnstoni TaxID=2874296 RepID=A0A8J2MLA6_9BILA|nr:unnamed protein product [Cercopithifilaria johnstoni]